MFIGIDDTDSTKGMCTTYLAAKLYRKLNAKGLPKLVRLNPNIPYKTRGNGAITFWTDDEGAEDTVLSYVKKYSILDDERTNPGVVFLKSDRIPQQIRDFYMSAVSELVTIDEAEKVAASVGAEVHKFKNGRGIIGALAALGFSGPSTYELIAYRMPGNYGKPRSIDKESVLKMDRLFYPQIFDNVGPKGKRILITPKGPDPIFCGIRGLSKGVVEDAWGMVKPLEPVEFVQVFETNHATDAHLRAKKISQIKPYDCVIVSGKVTSKPRTIRGGHMVFKLEDATGVIDCAAYKPTGSFQSIVKQLIEGDDVTAYGGIGKYANTINLEKIGVNSLSHPTSIVVPLCCGKNMTSAGKNKGFKCKKCGKKVSQNGAKLSQKSRTLNVGLYDVPPGSRRHISKPVFLMG